MLCEAFAQARRQCEMRELERLHAHVGDGELHFGSARRSQERPFTWRPHGVLRRYNSVPRAYGCRARYEGDAWFSSIRSPRPSIELTGRIEIEKMTAQEQELAELIVATLNLEMPAVEIDPAAPLYREGLGLDSIDILELAMAVS